MEALAAFLIMVCGSKDKVTSYTIEPRSSAKVICKTERIADNVPGSSTGTGIVLPPGVQMPYLSGTVQLNNKNAMTLTSTMRPIPLVTNCDGTKDERHHCAEVIKDLRDGGAFK